MNIKSGICLFLFIILVYFIYSSFFSTPSIQQDYTELSRKAAILESNYLKEKDLRKKAELIFNDEKKYLKDKISFLTEENFKLQNNRRVSSVIDLKGKKYLYHELHMVSRDGKIGPPIGYVMVYNDGHVVSKIYNHEIKVDTVVSEDSSGNLTATATANFILHQSGLANRKDSNKDNWINKPYPLDIVSGKIDFVKKDTKNKFNWLDLNFDLGINTLTKLDKNVSIYPSLGMTIMSYGDSKKHDKYRILRAGISGDTSDIIGTFSPILYNIGYNSNLISNTFIYPVIGKSFKDSSYSAGIGLSLGF